MITIPQIKAARALLDWTQNDLAQAAGLHVNAINKLESGFSTAPRTTTLQAIQGACEKGGVRFLGTYGVERTGDKLAISHYQGPRFIRAVTDEFLDDMTTSDEVLTLAAADSLSGLADKRDIDAYYEAKRRVGFSERFLVPREQKSFLGRRQDYRILPDILSGTVSWLTARDVHALIRWNSQQVIITRAHVTARAYKEQFDSLWQQATAFE